MKKTKSSERTGKTVKYITYLLLISLITALVLCLMFDDAFSLTAEEKTVTLVFEEPTGMWKSSMKLKENGLIRSRVWFYAYTVMRGNRYEVKEGSYTLYSAGGFDSFAGKLSGK